MFSKVDFLKERLLTDIKSGNLMVGGAIPSRNRLKSKYDLSLTTINRAIKELTDAGYLCARKGSRTYVATDSPVNTPKRLFAISGFNDNNLDPIKDLLFSGSSSLPFIALREEDAAGKMDQICQPGSAVIWICPNLDAMYMMDYLQKAGVPQILINRQYKDYDYVTTGTKESIREGLSWLLIEAGREIAFVSCQTSVEKPYLSERIIAFYESCFELGANLNSDRIFSRSFEDITGDISEIGKDLFLSEKRPRGIFVMQANLVLPLIAYARFHNLLPGRDFKLLTFDYIPELQGVEGVGMLRQQIKLFYREVNEWLEGAFVATSPFRKSIKAELVT